MTNISVFRAFYNCISSSKRFVGVLAVFLSADLYD
jgi:hypothetical protein